MNKVEVLAPVGGSEQLVAAVRCGADAVYLGAAGFNARQNAENFGNGTLKDAVSYCHVRDVRAHVTVNTLVMDHELEKLDETITEVAEGGADAVIIQDLAVLKRFTERCPDIARHASTQMTVHDLDGAKLMADMGFSRVVLSRELTLKEIEYITANCGIETEVFVHGALCMCMSGGCYLSAMLGGRSGNRGLCAQPCRLDFRAGTRPYALSLKDMSHLKHVQELSDAGVSSFKIEGRMKRPEYVAAAVTACRKALAGEKYDEDTLRAVFSRSGFTDGYLTGKRDLNMFGARSKEDVTAASGVLTELSALYRAERQSVPVRFAFKMSPDGSELTAKCGDDTVAVTGDTPQIAEHRPLDAESARRSLTKTGGTPYYIDSFSAEVAPGIMLPASSLNSMRRDALEKLTEIRAGKRKVDIKPANYRNIIPHEAGTPTLRGRFESVEQIACPDKLEKLIIPAHNLAGSPKTIEKYGDKIIAELPALLFDGDRDRLVNELESLKSMGIRDVYCDNCYGIKLAKELNLSVRGGHGLNIMNTDALEQFADLGLADATISFELLMSRISALGGEIPRGIIAYGYLPLMRFRSCPAKGKNGCGDCNGRPHLTDRKNVEFQMICGDKRYSTLLNSVPLHIADKPLAAVDFYTLYFTVETTQQAQKVIEDYCERRSAEYPRTGGLYYRTVR